MEADKVTEPIAQNLLNTELGLSTDELKRLTDFFSLLVQIDQKNKRKQKRNESI